MTGLRLAARASATRTAPRARLRRARRALAAARARGARLVAMPAGRGLGDVVRRAGGQGVREPAVAGQFYPADARALNALLDAVLKDAVPPARDAPIAIVAPHAGYVYSGQIAADAWRQAASHQYDTVVILGTNHTGVGSGRVGVFTGSGIRTPLGVAKVDQALAAALIKEDADCVADAAMHAGEHSVEVQIPFAQRLFPTSSIVAAIVASDDAGVVNRFGRTLGRLLAGRRALIVASSDLSHYPSWKDAVLADRRTLEAIASLDPDRVRSVGLRVAARCAQPRDVRLRRGPGHGRHGGRSCARAPRGDAW